MNEKFEKLLKKLNNGRTFGSQKKLAEKLNVTKSAVGQWVSGKEIPSEENIKKMAKIFDQTEDSLQKIFFSNSFSNNKNSFNTNFQKEIELKDKEIELKNKEIELLKKEIEMLKK